MVFNWLGKVIEEERKRQRKQIDLYLKNLGIKNRFEVLRDIIGEVRDDYQEIVEKILGFDPKSDIYLLQDYNRIMNLIGLNPPYPQIDILDEEGKLNVTLDVPGFSKENLELECAPNKIHVKGKTVIEGQDREIDKIIDLPRRTTPENAEAKLNNGILIVKIPLAK